ncbi:MAG TPA: ATP-binding protein [Polyangiales bacterium]
MAGWWRRWRARTLEPLWNAMERVATVGDLATRCEPLHGRELAPIREAFDSMIEHLERRERGREQYRRELQASLAAREAELSQLRKRMRDALDVLDQGVLAVDRHGMPWGERSSAFDRWFGAPEPGQSFAQVMGRASATFAKQLGQAWLQVEDGILPLPLALAQLPQTMTSYGGRAYKFGYHALQSSVAGGDGVLIVVSEVTASVELTARQQEQTRLLTLLSRVASDRANFTRFFQETEGLLRRLSEDTGRTAVVEQRALHTLGANLRLFGLGELATLVNEVEARCALGPLSADDRELLNETFQRFAERARPLLGIEPGRVEVDQRALQRLLDALRTTDAPATLRTLAERLQFEAVAPKLARLGEAAQLRAVQLGKDPPRIQVNADGVLAPPHVHWFWQVLPHVVNNAIEHGLELPARRREVGKSPQGTLRMSAREQGELLLVDIEDDGAGIDWEAVRAAALRLDLPARDSKDLQAALFKPGLSTVAANDTGHGLGLAALESRCRRRGVQIELRSLPGRGTSFRFQVPITRADGGASTRADDFDDPTGQRKLA